MRNTNGVSPIAQQPQRPFHRKSHSIRSIEANQNATHFDCIPPTLEDMHKYFIYNSNYCKITKYENYNHVVFHPFHPQYREPKNHCSQCTEKVCIFVQIRTPRAALFY